MSEEPSEWVAGDAPFVRSIFHPSDFSPESAKAFAHALAIALLRRTDLTLLHVVSDFIAEDEWRKFPAVRKTLERWGLLEEGSPRSAVFKRLGIGVQKVALERRRPLAAMLRFLEEHPTDLIVLATEGREGLPGWLRQSVAERLARRSRSMALFVPATCRGFVSLEDGGVRLRRILVPVDHSPEPTPAVMYAARSAVLAAGEPVAIHLLHVGDAANMPDVEIPETEACSFEHHTRTGPVVDEIDEAARMLDVDLIALATRGREGILDALRGSVTEQVVRRSPCPVLAVPVNA